MLYMSAALATFTLLRVRTVCGHLLSPKKDAVLDLTDEGRTWHKSPPVSKPSSQVGSVDGAQAPLMSV
eukprot:3260337-Amphidinium_carterae.1